MSLQPDDPFFDRMNRFMRAVKDESDRGEVLVSAAVIEEMLEVIIKTFLLDTAATKELFREGYGPVSSFAAKCDLARCLGLIREDEARDIKFVRKIRNHYAHHIECSFDDSQIANWAREMKVGLETLDGYEKGHPARVDAPRARFSMACFGIVGRLYNRAHYVAKVKLQETDWKF